MQNTRAHNNARTELEKFGALSVMKYLPSDSAKAQAVQKTVNVALAVFKSIRPHFIDDMPERWAETIAKVATQCIGLLNRLESHKDASDYQRYVEELETNLPGMIEQLNPVLHYCGFRNDSFGSMMEELTSFVAKHKEQSDQATKLIDNLKTALLAKGVLDQALYFGEEVKRHEKSSRIWLGLLLLSLVMLLTAAIGSIFLAYWIKDIVERFGYEYKDNTSSMIQIIVTKVLVISILTYFVIHCAKNYYANRHLTVVNRHRFNAIQSYKHFLDASSELEVKAAIVSYVAASVFSPQDTGFVTSTMTFEAPKNVPELIIKAMAGAAEGHK